MRLQHNVNTKVVISYVLVLRGGRGGGLGGRVGGLLHTILMVAGVRRVCII
jgi:hypothetical protein